MRDVDATMYRQIIGSLMYLTNMRPDIRFAVNTLIHTSTSDQFCHGQNVAISTEKRGYCHV